MDGWKTERRRRKSETVRMRNSEAYRDNGTKRGEQRPRDSKIEELRKKETERERRPER